jgi:hypothetical protein
VNTDVGGSVCTTARAWLARNAVPTAPTKSRRPSTDHALALIVVGPIAVARWSSLAVLLADRRTLADLLISQTARWLGCVFLVLEVGGQLRGVFAYPAAFGDIAVGLTACVTVIARWPVRTIVKSIHLAVSRRQAQPDREHDHKGTRQP